MAVRVRVRNRLLRSALEKGLEGEGMRITGERGWNVLVCDELPRREEIGACVVLIETLEEGSWAMLHGAAGCHFYDDEIGKLAEKIRRVAEGEVACSVEILQMAIRGEHGNRLTYRERQVLCLVNQGLRNKEIAKALGISLHTAKNHVHSLFQKLGAKRRYELSQSLVGRSKGGGAGMD